MLCVCVCACARAYVYMHSCSLSAPVIIAQSCVLIEAEEVVYRAECTRCISYVGQRTSFISPFMSCVQPVHSTLQQFSCLMDQIDGVILLTVKFNKMWTILCLCYFLSVCVMMAVSQWLVYSSILCSCHLPMV